MMNTNKYLVIVLSAFLLGMLISCSPKKVPEPTLIPTQQINTSEPIEPTTDPTQIAQSKDQLISALLFDFENFLQANDIDSALNALQLALDIKPGNRDILLIRATLYFETLQFEAALSDTDKILSSDENDVEARYLRGNIYFSNGNIDDAIFEFNKVIELDPNYLNAYIQLGFLYVNESESEMAIEIFNRYIELADDGEDKNYIIDFADTLQQNLESETTETTQE